ncbi:MAG: putative immunity protein [Syntrophomonadaceae bacterium]
MFSDVELKLKKRNKILFSRESQCLQELINLIEIQNHRALVMWALDCAQTTLDQFEQKYPLEIRPRKSLEHSEAWARGKIKMPKARRAILDAHAVAKEISDDEYGALAHAIGHAASTVHVETHALGFVFYELTSIVLKYGKHNYEKPVSDKIGDYCQRLIYWQENTDKHGYEWAEFLKYDDRPNKEKLLNEKRRSKLPDSCH